MTKTAYLTIDDAPSKDFKRKVNYLASKGIPAIFFCRGDFLEKRSKAAIYAIKKGFIIGNHSYDHPNFSKIPLEEAENQIKKTDEIIEELYRKACVRRPIKVFRFPELDKGGENKEVLQKFLKKLGYEQPKFEKINYKWYKKDGHHKDVDVYCTYDTYDWAVLEANPPHGIKGLKEVLARMDEDVPEGHRGLNYPNSNEIIIMHDFSETADMFIPMIKKLVKKGLKFELPKL